MILPDRESAKIIEEWAKAHEGISSEQIHEWIESYEHRLLENNPPLVSTERIALQRRIGKLFAVIQYREDHA